MKHSRIYFSLTLGTTFLIAIILGVVSACTDRSSARAKPNFVFKDAPSSGAVAKIGGVEISEEELIGDAKLKMIEIKKQEYDLKMDQLNRLVREKVIGAEAKKAGVSLDDYMKNNVTKNVKKPTDSQFKKFIAEKKFPESQVNDRLKAQIMGYLEEQSRETAINEVVAKLTRSSPIEVYFKKPNAKIDIALGAAPVTGKDNAPVTIVAFSDFQCPFCSKGAVVIDEVKKKYGNKVKIAFKHFPLSFHKDAKPAAEAAMCVHEQGADKFWKFHDLLFKNQKELEPANLEKQAKAVGVNLAKYQECVNSHRPAKIIEEDMAYGEKIGVRSTPTFFVNGSIISGAVPIEQFAETIDEALEDTKKN